MGLFLAAGIKARHGSALCLHALAIDRTDVIDIPYPKDIPRTRSAFSTMQRHSFTALNSTFVVDSEYHFVKELGQGAYGCVVAARHRRSGEGCAIKKITNINTKVCTHRTSHDLIIQNRFISSGF